MTSRSGSSKKSTVTDTNRHSAGKFRQVRSRSQVLQNKTKFAKSSPEARRLIRAALHGRNSKGKPNSWVQVASILKLPTGAQAYKMYFGLIKDTPSMKAAIKRADARAKRAWSMVRLDHQEIDCVQVLNDVRDVARRIAVIEANVKAYSEVTHKDVKA